MELKFKDLSTTKVFSKITVCQAVKIGKKEFTSFEEDRDGYAVAVDGEIKFNLRGIEFERYNVIKMVNGSGGTAKCSLTAVDDFKSVKDAIIRDRNGIVDVTDDVLMADGRRIERYTYIGDVLYSVAKNGRMYKVENMWRGFSLKKKNPSGEEYFIYSDRRVRDLEDFIIFAYGLKRRD